MIFNHCGREYEADIHVGLGVIHDTLGCGLVTYISSNPKTACPIKVHFTEAQKFVSYTITGKEYVAQSDPVIDFGAKETGKKSKGRVDELIDDLHFLKEQKPGLGIGNIQYNRTKREFTITLV